MAATISQFVDYLKVVPDISAISRRCDPDITVNLHPFGTDLSQMPRNIPACISIGILLPATKISDTWQISLCNKYASAHYKNLCLRSFRSSTELYEALVKEIRYLQVKYRGEAFISIQASLQKAQQRLYLSQQKLVAIQNETIRLHKEMCVAGMNGLLGKVVRDRSVAHLSGLLTHDGHAACIYNKQLFKYISNDNTASVSKLSQVVNSSNVAYEKFKYYLKQVTHLENQLNHLFKIQRDEIQYNHVALKYMSNK